MTIKALFISSACLWLHLLAMAKSQEEKVIIREKFEKIIILPLYLLRQLFVQLGLPLRIQ